MRSIRRNRQSSRGFTLIEMIVATIVLAIGVVGASAAFNMATKASSVATDLQTAAMLAQQQLEQTEVNAQGSITPGDSDGEFGNDFPGFKWHQSITSTDYTYLFQVTVTVKWGSRPERQKSVTTYLTNAQPTSTSTTSTSTTGTGTGG